jgi:hypothetical protein
MRILERLFLLSKTYDVLEPLTSQSSTLIKHILNSFLPQLLTKTRETLRRASNPTHVLNWPVLAALAYDESTRLDEIGPAHCALRAVLVEKPP